MFPERYSAIIVGPPGSGLLEFGSYLASFYLKNNQSVIFVEADTSANLIRRQLKSFGANPDNYEGSTLTLIDCFSSTKSPDDLRILTDPGNLPELLENIKQAIQQNMEPVRVIFDSLSPLYIESSPDDVLQFLEHLAGLAKEKGSLTATIHREMHKASQIEKIINLCDGLIEMRFDERMNRFIRISRMLSMDIEPTWVPFELESLTTSEGAYLVWNKESNASDDDN